MDQELFTVLQRYVRQSNEIVRNFYEQVDRSRRWLGQQLDAAGLGPVERPYEVVFSEPAFTLRRYHSDTAPPDGPVVLIVPAPIKKAYIWDLAPGASVVQRCLDSGLSVYLMYWEQPGEQERGFGLPEYADRFVLESLQVIEKVGGQSRAVLAGHSLGGTFAAIFAALHPERVQGLVLLGTPVHFGPDVGALDALVAAAPRADILTAMLGNMSGTFMGRAAFMAAPGTFGPERWIDWLNSLPHPEAMQTHLRVERWALDEMPFPQQLFEEVVELLYREDRFMQGSLMVGEKLATPEQVTAPLLSVIERGSRIVPPESTLPFHDAVRSRETKVLWYEGDTGVSIQHLGMLVGENAHQHLWPEILRWTHDHAQPE